MPRSLRHVFRPIAPRSSAIEHGLVLSSILSAVVLAVMALVVYRINLDAADAARRAIRSIEVAATLDKLQLALRDGDMAVRDLAASRSRGDSGRNDAERLDAARFQARLHLNALGPLTGDDADQSERLSTLGPAITRKFDASGRREDPSLPFTRDGIDSLVASMRDDETRRLEGYRATQRDASEKSTSMMVGALGLVSALSLVFWILLKIEFTARRALERRLIESATLDELTGVGNRSDFDRKLVQEWTFRARYGTALSLLVIDIDRLKAINDEWGHDTGDAVLREVARRLATRLRRTEVLARIGGDEFGIVVPLYRKEAVAMAEQLRDQIAAAPFHVQGGERPIPIRVTVSIGVADASDVASPRELLATADAATYAAKDAGRDRVEAFRPNPNTLAAIRASTGPSVIRPEPLKRTGT